MKITVVIPLFNKEKSIVNTVKSVLAQTFEPKEIIIVNDGSTDKSLEKVRSINDPKIKILEKINGGVNSARNAGIKSSQYPWIAFLDADDIWLMNHLETLYLLWKKYPGNWAYTTSFMLSSDVSKTELDGYRTDYVVNNYFKEVIKKNITNSSCCLINIQSFNECGYFNEELRRGEDIEMWYRIAKRYNFVKSNLKTSIYNLEAENRGMKSIVPYKYSFASIIDLSNANSVDELIYLKSQIKAKYKSCLYNKEWVNLWDCFVQHKLSFL